MGETVENHKKKNEKKHKPEEIKRETKDKKETNRTLNVSQPDATPREQLAPILRVMVNRGRDSKASGGG